MSTVGATTTTPEPNGHRRRAAPLLAVEGVSFAYGQLQVLFDVDITVWPGEVLALLGTNGAGKSTVLKVISGLVKEMDGRIRLEGEDLAGVPAEARVRAGIVQVPGGNAVFPTLSVADNLAAGSYTIRSDRERVQARVNDVLELFPVLRDRLPQPAGTLSGGEQQMLGLAKGLLLDPTLLLIDELSLGLAPVVVQQLLEVVAVLKEKGVTMVIVEQSVNVALDLADRAVFMEKGAVRFEGPAVDLRERDDLLRAVFLGAQGG